MPLHPDCRHAIHFLAALRVGKLGSVAVAVADAPHPDFPVSQRRRQRQDCKRNVRAGGEDQGILHDQRDLQAGRNLPAIGSRRGRRREHSATKSFREQREAIFHPRDFALLSNCHAICIPYDGAQTLEACRVYLKPHYLPLDYSYWRAKEAGQL